ncbi:MAG: NAD-dependent succinate-semialdehyde dehydrogenase [Rhizobiaceae bacterium]
MIQDYSHLGHYVGGEWDFNTSDACEVINPATEEVLELLPQASTGQMDVALTSAEAGLEIWRHRTPIERSDIMRHAASLVRDRQDVIATALTLEQGKPIGEARIEVAISADTIDWFAEEGRRAYGRIIAGRASGTEFHVRHEPVGVCLLITPWNFPIGMLARKLGGALAAGCSVIATPSNETPASAVEFVRAFHDAGLPANVLNLVFGPSAKLSSHFMASSVVRKVSFTGSTPVGQLLMRLAADNVQRLTLELGGHAPVVVLDDVDLDATVEALAAGKYRNAGQVCVSPTRFYVEESIFKQFSERFTEFAASRVVGNGLDEDVHMGPMANSRRLDRLDALVADARDRGAEILTGGNRCRNQGYFFEPTVIAAPPDESLVMTEEPFGPIAALTSFSTDDEVLNRANALPYGLAAYVFGKSRNRLRQIAEGFEAGLVGANTLGVGSPEAPFGGVKASGFGSEGGVEGMESYLTVKSISIT